MTTILVTKDFILSDYAISKAEELNRQELTKQYRTKDSKAVLVHSGYRSFPWKIATYEELYDSLLGLIKYKTSGENYNICMDHLNAVLGPGGSIAMMLSDFSYYYEVKDSVLCIMYKDEVYATGTGGLSALYFWKLGIKPEDVMSMVADLDITSTARYDIVYRKELSK